MPPPRTLDTNKHPLPRRAGARHREPFERHCHCHAHGYVVRLAVQTSPARIEFGAAYGLKPLVGHTYVYLVTFHQVIDNELTTTWLPFTIKIHR